MNMAEKLPASTTEHTQRSWSVVILFEEHAIPSYLTLSPREGAIIEHLRDVQEGAQGQWTRHVSITRVLSEPISVSGITYLNALMRLGKIRYWYQSELTPSIEKEQVEAL